MIYYYAYFMWCLFILSVCFYECKRDKDTVGSFVNCFIYCVPLIGQALFLWVLLGNGIKSLKERPAYHKIFSFIRKIMDKKL